MSDFYIEKSITVGHGDGWRYVIHIDDDPPVISIRYQEFYDNKWNDKECICGLWKESAKMIANALIELADMIEE